MTTLQSTKDTTSTTAPAPVEVADVSADDRAALIAIAVGVVEGRAGTNLPGSAWKIEHNPIATPTRHPVYTGRKGSARITATADGVAYKIIVWHNGVHSKNPAIMWIGEGLTLNEALAEAERICDKGVQIPTGGDEKKAGRYTYGPADDRGRTPVAVDGIHVGHVRKLGGGAEPWFAQGDAPAYGEKGATPHKTKRAAAERLVGLVDVRAMTEAETQRRRERRTMKVDGWRWASWAEIDEQQLSPVRLVARARRISYAKDELDLYPEYFTNPVGIRSVNRNDNGTVVASGNEYGVTTTYVLLMLADHATLGALVPDPAPGLVPATSVEDGEEELASVTRDFMTACEETDDETAHATYEAQTVAAGRLYLALTKPEEGDDEPGAPAPVPTSTAPAAPAAAAEEPAVDEVQVQLAAGVEAWRLPVDAKGRTVKVGDLVVQDFFEQTRARRVTRVYEYGNWQAEAVSDTDGSVFVEHTNRLRIVTQEQVDAHIRVDVEDAGHRGRIVQALVSSKAGQFRVVCTCLDGMEVIETGRSRAIAWRRTVDEARQVWAQHVKESGPIHTPVSWTQKVHGIRHEKWTAASDLQQVQGVIVTGANHGGRCDMCGRDFGFLIEVEVDGTSYQADRWCLGQHTDARAQCGGVDVETVACEYAGTTWRDLVDEGKAQRQAQHEYERNLRNAYALWWVDNTDAVPLGEELPDGWSTNQLGEADKYAIDVTTGYGHTYRVNTRPGPVLRVRTDNGLVRHGSETWAGIFEVVNADSINQARNEVERAPGTCHADKPCNHAWPCGRDLEEWKARQPKSRAELRKEQQAEARAVKAKADEEAKKARAAAPNVTIRPGGPGQYTAHCERERYAVVLEDTHNGGRWTVTAPDGTRIGVFDLSHDIDAHHPPSALVKACVRTHRAGTGRAEGLTLTQTSSYGWDVTVTGDEKRSYAIYHDNRGRTVGYLPQGVDWGIHYIARTEGDDIHVSTIHQAEHLGLDRACQLITAHHTTQQQATGHRADEDGVTAVSVREAVAIEEQTAEERTAVEESGTDPVVVFIASRGGSPARMRVLWRVTRAEAMRICSDERTASKRSMLCWTADPGKQGVDWAYTRDSGKHTELLAELGITPMPREGKAIKPAAQAEPQPAPAEERAAFADHDQPVTFTWGKGDFERKVTASWRGMDFLVRKLYEGSELRVTRGWSDRYLKMPDGKHPGTEKDAERVMAAHIADRKALEVTTAKLIADKTSVAAGTVPALKRTDNTVAGGRPAVQPLKPRRTPKTDKTPQQILDTYGEQVTYEEIAVPAPEQQSPERQVPALPTVPARLELEAAPAPVLVPVPTGGITNGVAGALAVALQAAAQNLTQPDLATTGTEA